MKVFIVPCGWVASLTILLVVFSPSPALAQDLAFGVSPTEVTIENLAPGQTAEFELSLRNKDDLPLTLAVTTFRPPCDRRRQGRGEFPDTGWISISDREIELPAGSESTLTVAIAIPAQQQWAGHDWEIWITVTTQSDDLLAVELYVRLLVSTAAPARPGATARLLGGLALGLLIFGCLVHQRYLRNKLRGA